LIIVSAWCQIKLHFTSLPFGCVFSFSVERRSLPSPEEDRQSTAEPSPRGSIDRQSPELAVSDRADSAPSPANREPSPGSRSPKTAAATDDSSPDLDLVLAAARSPEPGSRTAAADGLRPTVGVSPPPLPSPPTLVTSAASEEELNDDDAAALVITDVAKYVSNNYNHNSIYLPKAGPRKGHVPIKAGSLQINGCYLHKLCCFFVVFVFAAVFGEYKMYIKTQIRHKYYSNIIHILCNSIQVRLEHSELWTSACKHN